MLDGKLSFLKIEEGKWRLTNSYVLSPPCRMKGLDTDLPEPPSREHTNKVSLDLCTWGSGLAEDTPRQERHLQ